MKGKRKSEEEKDEVSLDDIAGLLRWEYGMRNLR